MLGAIAGDIIGSPYEFTHNNIKTKDFELFGQRSAFTDDSVLTAATAVALMDSRNYAETYRRFYGMYPFAGYGTRFLQWARSSNEGPYGSYGNGSAMRVSPVGWAFDTLEQTLREAARSAAVSHNHPEGIRGAQAVAGAVFLARTGHDKEGIRRWVVDAMGYDLSRTCDDIRPSYVHVESCQETVPEAVTAFLESTDFEDAVRLAVSLGGDSDTLTCITAAIAEAFYGAVPEPIARAARLRLDERLRSILDQWYSWLAERRA
jgi:ADP-ribosylglycohydrolase